MPGVYFLAPRSKSSTRRRRSAIWRSLVSSAASTFSAQSSMRVLQRRPVCHSAAFRSKRRAWLSKRTAISAISFLRLPISLSRLFFRSIINSSRCSTVPAPPPRRIVTPVGATALLQPESCWRRASATGTLAHTAAFHLSLHLPQDLLRVGQTPRGVLYVRDPRCFRFGAKGQDVAKHQVGGGVRLGQRERPPRALLCKCEVARLEKEDRQHIVRIPGIRIEFHGAV